MPLFSRFTPFGHLAFSAKPSHGEAIFQILKDNFGDSFIGTDVDLHQARLYATSMVFASAQYQLDRAKNNKSPATATELLGVLEGDYQVVPNPRAHLPARRAYLTAVQTIKRGNRREAIEDALRMLLGSDFVEYRTAQPFAAVVAPASLPGHVGVFTARGALRKAFSIDAAIATTFVPVTVPYTSIGGTSAPVIGETYCVDPDPRHAIEQITVQAVTATIITATFLYAHEAGTLAVRPFPYLESTQRYNAIVVTPSAAIDPEKRRRVNEYLRRALRGVSPWAIVTNAGVFTPNVSGLDLPDSVPVQ